MTRLFTEGFESGDSLGLTYFNHNAGGIVTTLARSGVYSAYPREREMYKQFTASYSELYVRAGMNMYAASSPILYWKKGATVLGSVTINNTTHHIEVRVGTTVMATGTPLRMMSGWFLLEAHIKIHDTTGIVEVRYDGQNDVSFSGDTKPGADTAIDLINWTPTNYIYYDDLAINDTVGAVDNSWCGDGHIIALAPNANGDLSQLDGSDGNKTDNYLLVDEKPSNSDTDYVEGSVAGNTDLYNFESAGVTGTILHVWAEARAKDTVAASGTLILDIKTGGVEYNSPNLILLTTYGQMLGPLYNYNPGTSGTTWTDSDLTAIQAGPKVGS